MWCLNFGILQLKNWFSTWKKGYHWAKPLWKWWWLNLCSWEKKQQLITTCCMDFVFNHCQCLRITHNIYYNSNVNVMLFFFFRWAEVTHCPCHWILVSSILRNTVFIKSIYRAKEIGYHGGGGGLTKKGGSCLGCLEVWRYYDHACINIANNGYCCRSSSAVSPVRSST